MRYILAVVVCGVEGLACAVISALLGWTRGGGILPMMILFAVWAATWGAITNAGVSASDGGVDPILPLKPSED